MTESRINSFEQGKRCRICTGCGRCPGVRKTDVVRSFFQTEQSETEGSLPASAGEASFVSEKRREGKGNYLAVADIGTTTIAMQLRNLWDGTVSDSYTCLNPQRVYGADVLSRIQAAEAPLVKAKLKAAVREALRAGLEQFTERLKKMGETERGICGLVIAANTTMVHLLLGYDTDGLGRAPFTPVTLSEIRTELFDIDTLILPGVSAFVGGDIVAGIHALSMHKRQEITLLLDLGTNGEMVLGNRDGLLATAAAAGPAFEGGTDNHGADLMALTARLLREEILDTTGLLQEPYFTEGITIGGVRLTQQYIRQLQLAKSAICTGIRILCRKYGIKDLSDIDRVWLAGGMGYYLDPAAAVEIGLLPGELGERTAAVGNAALEGAFSYALDPAGCPQIADFNLAKEEDFSDGYIAGMNLEKTDFTDV